MIEGGSGNGCWGDGYGGRWVVEVVWVWKVVEGRRWGGCMSGWIVEEVGVNGRVDGGG